MSDLEGRIGQWRSAVLRGRAVDDADADELESHLREQLAELEAAGLSGDEAFLIAVKRLGEVDRISAEFAREHGDRLWKQLVIPRADAERGRPLLVMIGFALLAAVLVQAGRVLSGVTDARAFELLGEPAGAWFFRNAALLVLPALAGYFVVIRRMPARRFLPLSAAVTALALAINLFPYQPSGATELLVAIHLFVVLWFAVGVAYVGGDVASRSRRMDFIRFSGEWAIYFVLIALGGMLLMGLTVAVLMPIAPEAVAPLTRWVPLSGAAAATVVAAWLVEAKKGVIENLAPVLTAIFTPLFAVMLLVSATVYAVAGVGREFDRDLLLVFDVLLLVVLGLVVYAISARVPEQRAGLMDVIRLVAVIAAVALDLLVLAAMLIRVGEFGFTPNRFVALGLNLILLVNLVVSAWVMLRVILGRAPAVRIDRWQVGYLNVFAAWAVMVVLAVPPAFGFV